MSGATGAVNSVTQAKLNSLNVNDLSLEDLYVNSIILQTKNIGLTGGTGYVISVAPPSLNQTVLYSNLQSAFIGSTVVPTVTRGYTGYKINWS